MPERSPDPDEVVLPEHLDDPLPPRQEGIEALVDLVESALHYLRQHPPPGGSARAQHRALVGHMERVLARTPGYPQDAGTPLLRPSRPWSPAEARVAALVVELDGGRGAHWDELFRVATRGGLAVREVEEALVALLDRGVLYEPTLGRLKRA